MIPIPPNTRSLRLMSSHGSLTSGRTGLIRSLSPTMENCMVRRSTLSADAPNVISRTAAPVCTCLRCDAPKPFLYKNNGSKGQLLCKVCAARFSPDESRFSSVKLRCPTEGIPWFPRKTAGTSFSTSASTPNASTTSTI